jgi:16S rRNA (cytosine1402-N4)-methyltransferase
MTHQTVLLNEAVEALNLQADGHYVDGTFGRGGHSRKILESLGEGATLLVIDKDPAAIEVAQDLKKEDGRVQIMHGSFSDIKSLVGETGLLGKIDGVLLDLGLSSPQLDESERGFSFMRKGPLDMRMNNEGGVSAKDWLKTVGESELASVIKEYGEERFSKRIARAIVEAREEVSIDDTKQLADIVSKAIPKWEKHKHPATRTFQAIRIFINQELDDLQKALDDVLEVLAIGGRVVVISFHSLEDRIVKIWIKRMAKGDDVPSYIPITYKDLNQKLNIIGKAIKPSAQEVEQNPRARSAIMRIAEKI